MPAIRTQDAVDPAYLKTPGEEPLPGYVLLEPLGRGGYGEVWKCEAPGGLLKAIKFVAGDPDGQPREASLLQQEFEAFQQVKAIRHPFLLPLERVELIGGELVMVMGLADKHVGDRFNECIAEGLRGIPRDELLGYLREAAEALDVIGAQYGLQHLDVKPANLFLTAGHLQVGDYGLVSKLDGGTDNGANRGLTPKYAAPEVLRGRVHTRSDQYSLALVYFELLTGQFPFIGKSAQQMMMQHVSVPPTLTALPEVERAVVAVALAKTPDARHASCLDFVDALIEVRPPARGQSGVFALGARPVSGPLSTPPTQRTLANPPTQRPFAADSTKRGALAGTVPKLVGVRPQPALSRPAPPPDDDDASCIDLTAVSAVPAGRAVYLPDIRSIHPVERLFGRPCPNPHLDAPTVAQQVLAAAGYDPTVHFAPDDVIREGEWAWSCRFPCTIDPRLARVKLDVVREQTGIPLDATDPMRLVFRELAPTGFFGKKGSAGLEVAVHLPQAGNRHPDLLVTGQIFGKPPADFVKSAEDAIPAFIEAIRKQLHNVSERRKHARVPVEFAVTLFALHSDRRVEEPVYSRTVDVSASGLAVRAAQFPPCKYFYVTFDDVRGLDDLALLAETVRRKEQPGEVLLTGTYRFDL